ncbi:adapter and scaffold ECM29-like [Octopus vulgaris]|uniref:Adapter and scaffold ECM29-like n=1 Tax=Octopus vulgaris TaxID=6645 RepID=A0AA36FJZ0_OCTVU|nr:adapter and scaffold ECM29-like [Octopus vulgaris]
MSGEDDLMRLERVFLRIASADTDENIEVALGKFLAPVLSRLSSPQEEVRKKVMELLVHINKRLKTRPKVQLPVQSLLTQYQDPSASPFITNFTILYIKKGYPRLEPAQQAELIPNLLNCIEGRPQPQQDSLFQLLVPALQHVKIPSDPSKLEQMYQFSERPNISRLFLDYVMDVLLLPYNAHATVTSGDNSTPAIPPPGMSEQSLKRVTGDNPLKPEELEKCKLGILNFLGSGIFPDEKVVCHYIIGAADTRHSIATAGDMELKKVMGSINWNSLVIMNKLFSIFLGTTVIKGKESQVKPECRKTPASTRIRLKIFPYFLKSREATNVFPACIQVIFHCLFASNNHARLSLMTVELVHHVCYNASDVVFKPISAELLSSMVKVLKSSKDDKLRALTYVAIGKIIKRCPNLVANDIALIKQFFEAVCTEESEIRLAVQESLSLMASAFKGQNDENKKLMEELIMENIEEEMFQARAVSVQYARSVFPDDHIPSRYVLLLASGDVKEDIRNEAMKTLHLTKQYSKKETKEQFALPGFCEMVRYIHDKAQQKIESKVGYVIGNQTLPFSPEAFTQIILFLRMCLANNAGAVENIDSEESASNIQQQQAPLISSYVIKLLDEGASLPNKLDGPVYMYINLIQQLLPSIRDGRLMYCLLEVIAGAPTYLASLFSNQLDWIKRLSCSTKDDMTEHAAQLYSIVLHNTADNNSIVKSISEFYENLDTNNVQLQHSSILILGYIISCYLSHNSRPGAMEEDGQKEMYAAMTKTLKKLVKFLDESNPLLCHGVCLALSEIGRSGPLPLANGSETQEASEETTKLSVVKSLLSLVQSTRDKDAMKNKERAAMSLGHLCIGDEEFPYRHMVIEGLMGVVQAKQIDLHLTIGEALVCAAQGIKCPSRKNTWLATSSDFQASVADKGDDVEWYLLKILNEYIVKNNPFIRQAACMWLLSLVKHCGSHPALQKRLPNIQAAFMAMLSENDEITQDITSKGLSLVYENCSSEQKDALVSGLVDTLLTGKRSKTVVTGDTEVFSVGSLGKTPEGGSMSTYKELCSIATDLNQPDLIYKFMHLANHQAAWNSKKGAAFGFSTIAQYAGEQLAPYLPQIVPKLYRYQFDPNPKIQRAMSSIWDALVPEKGKTLDLYLNAIVDDLLKNLTASEWRVRESCCYAVSNLLQGRQLNSIIEKLPLLWEVCLQVRDDIKESVRTAAHQACKTLSRESIKNCDLNNSKIGEQAISLVLPCLLKNCLQSRVEEVQTIGLRTILKISKNAGKLIKPHIPVLTIALLEAVSGLEPQVMNYLAVKAEAGSQGTQEKLDMARIAASKMSPMMETVNSCVQYVDASVLPELIPRLIELIKSGIGVGTKAGCASFITSLATHCPHDLTPYAGKLMNSMLTGLSDRNVSVRKSYASAVGYLVKVAKDSSTEKLMLKLKTWYMEKDESAQTACGATLYAISQRSPDILKRHAALVMPFVFFAMHEPKNTTKDSDSSLSIWDEIWFEIAPGTEPGIRLYLQEITEILCLSLESQQWNTKGQAARAIGTVATKLGPKLTSPSGDILLKALLTGLSGRTWKGKENLLEAVGKICCNCKPLLEDRTEATEDKPDINQVLDVVLRECKKENKEYRIKGLHTAGSILELYKVDRFEVLWLLLQPSLNTSESDSNEDEDNSVTSLGIKLEYQQAVFECLGKVWPENAQTQTTYQELFCEQLCQSLMRGVWKIQISIMKSIQKYLDRLLIWKDQNAVSNNVAMVSKIINQILSSVIPCLGNMKYSVIRSEAMVVITQVVRKLHDLDNRALLTEKLSEELMNSLTPFMENDKSEMHQKAVDVASLLKPSMEIS